MRNVNECSLAFAAINEETFKNEAKQIIDVQNLQACHILMPEIEEQRKKVKAYLKAFNKQIEKAI